MEWGVCSEEIAFLLLKETGRMKLETPFLVAKGCSGVQTSDALLQTLWATIMKKGQIVKNVINQSLGEAAEWS